MCSSRSTEERREEKRKEGKKEKEREEGGEEEGEEINDFSDQKVEELYSTRFMNFKKEKIHYKLIKSQNYKWYQ